VGTAIIFEKKIPVYIPVPNYIQNKKIILQHQLDLSRPYCQFNPKRDTKEIDEGASVIVRSIIGRTSKFSFSNPFYTVFDILADKLISEFRCINGTKNSEMTLGEMLDVTEGVVRFNFKFQNLVELNTEHKVVDLDEHTVFRFNGKLGFFENFSIFYQDGKIVELDAIDKGRSYCLLSAKQNTVIHPEDESVINRIYTAYSINKTVLEPYSVNVVLKDLGVVVRCIEPSANQQSSIDEMIYQFGGFLTVLAMI
jgi:hypothetical protein